MLSTPRTFHEPLRHGLPGVLSRHDPDLPAVGPGLAWTQRPTAVNPRYRRLHARHPWRAVNIVRSLVARPDSHPFGLNNP